MSRLLAPELLAGRGELAGLIGVGAPTYSPAEALAAARMGNPWLHAAVSYRAADTAGLPFRVRVGRGEKAVELDDHPILDLIEQPNTTDTGELYRRQQWVDLDLTGNHYGIAVGDNEPESVIRLHPDHVTVRATRTHISAYVYRDESGEMEIDPDDMIHVRHPSFSDGAQVHIGSGKVEAVNDELAAVYHLTKRLAEDARVGQPTWLISPKKEIGTFTREQLDLLAERFTQSLLSRQKVITQGASIDATQLSHKISDMDPSGTREHARQSIIAACGMVPVRLGLETANYAQSREMMRLYWRGLQSDARLVDAGWTRLGRMFERGKSRKLYVAHNFAGVEWLQQDRSDAQKRAKVWMDDFHLEPAYAASIEGFEDVDFTRVVEQPADDAGAQVIEELQAAAKLLETDGGDPEAVADALASIVWALGKTRETVKIEEAA